MDCEVCKLPIVVESGSCGTGYGIDESGKKVCYKCCGEQDRNRMIYESNIVLYFVESKEGVKVTNWPGTFTINHVGVSKSRTNWGHVRRDIWIVGPDKYRWYGRLIGDNNQAVQFKRTKHYVG